MAKLSKHAKERLAERFGIAYEWLCVDIGNMFNQNYEIVKTDGVEEHREIVFQGATIHGIVKDNLIVTVFEKTTLPDPLAIGVQNLHNQLSLFKKENEELKEKLNKGNDVSKANCVWFDTMSIGNTVKETMSIKELSIVLGVSRDLIEKRVKELFPNKMRKGITTNLTENEVTAISLRVKENSSIISTSDDRRKIPKTDLEKEMLIQQAMIFQAEKIQLMQTQIETMIPKAEFYDKVTDSKQTIDMGEAAKALNIKDLGRTKLFAFLRDQRIFMHNNQPYQEFIDRGYFRVVEQAYTKPGGSQHVRLKTVVYQKGLDYIMKRFSSSMVGE